MARFVVKWPVLHNFYFFYFNFVFLVLLIGILVDLTGNNKTLCVKEFDIKILENFIKL